MEDVPQQDRNGRLAWQRRFGDVAENVADAIVIVDEACRVEYVNAAAERLFGLSCDVALSRRCDRPPFLPMRPDGTPLPVDELAFNRALTAGEDSTGVELLIRRPDGSQSVVLAGGSPLRDGDGSLLGAIACYTDITERRRAEEELEERCTYDASLLRLYGSLGGAFSYSAILRSLRAEVPSVLGYGHTDLLLLEGDPPRFHAVQVRDRSQKTATSALGVCHRFRDDPDAGHPAVVRHIAGDPFLERIAEADETVVVEDARTDPCTDKEAVAVAGDVTIVSVPIVLAGRKLGVLVTGTDSDQGVRPPTRAQLDYVSALSNHVAAAMDRVRSQRERAATEATMRESEELYRRFVETSMEGVWAVDASMHTVYASDRMTQLLGCPPGDMLGRSMLEFVSEEQAPGFVARMARRRSGETEAYEMRFRRCDGSTVWLHMSATPIISASGEYQGSFAMATDISARKATESLLEIALERTQLVLDGVVEALAATTSQRDPYTALHQERVARLAVAIAEDMRLGRRFIEGLRIAALLHDVGKIAVPSEILSKPGKLNEMEMGIVRAHASIGHGMLEHVPFETPVARAVLQHHERLDGSGYPDGLHGDELLLEARILAVADVVEAMASHRPYRPALGMDAALEAVTEGSGSAFDERVVAACVGVAGEAVTVT